jgi:hypothetical protein
MQEVVDFLQAATEQCKHQGQAHHDRPFQEATKLQISGRLLFAVRMELCCLSNVGLLQGCNEADSLAFKPYV